jgi:hypothetical protein
MALFILNSNPEVDEKIKTIFNYILPSESGRLYSILDNSNLKPQTLQMDKRTVQIELISYEIKLTSV